MTVTNSKARLFLLDGMALAYRVYFAFARSPLINSRGENVSTVFGFTNTLLNILDTEQPEYFAVVFDTPEPTFRHELYEEYKAQRKEMPDDMVEQLPRIHEMLEILRIPVLEKPGFEADDIIGTLAKRAAEENIETVIVSGDKDMMQLVDSNIVMLNPKRGGEEPEWLDADAVEEKIGLPPEKIIDYLALMGDSSDNIPGVPGIGPKSALKLLQEYNSLDNVLQHMEDISDKRSRTALLKSPESANISKTLATIHCDVPLDLKPLDLKVGEGDRQVAFEFFQNMEFRTLADRFAPEQPQLKREYHLIQTEEHLNELVDALASSEQFAFDTETTSEDPMRAQLVGVSFSFKDGEAHYIPVDGPEELTSDAKALPRDTVVHALKPVFEDATLQKCAHNAKYDILVLSHYNINVKGLTFDTMVANYLLDPSTRQHNLDALALTYLNVKKIPTKTIIGSGAKQTTMDKVDIETVAEYACEDADVTWRLWNVLAPKLSELNLQPLMDEVEVPLIHVLTNVERNGVSLDQAYLAKMSTKVQGDLADLELKIYEFAGRNLNINSPK